MSKAYPVMHANIKQKIRFSLHGQSAQLGEIEVQRVLPNEFAQAVGPFVFIEHFLSYKQPQRELHKGLVDNRSNPCRGIATLTYILAGEVEHWDSIGNHVKLSSGGVHWTNAGKGIVHNEAVMAELGVTNSDVSVVRFWVNLPSEHKSGKPDYFFLKSNEIPKKELDGIAGWIKILSGEYGNAIAKIPCYSIEFLYHIHLEAGKQFSITTNHAIEYAAFLPSDKAVINDIEFQAGKLVVFTSHGELIEINNSNSTGIDIILFGGQPYSEPIVSDGFFVMNTPHEITQAYNDYYDGKFGQIEPQ
jgi:redox-sensitive bicupin YhaK (pirin superfamily)